MKTALSYCLFDPITLHPHRTWDDFTLDKTRYWFNIPALYIANKVLYPDYEMKIFCNEELKRNKLFPLLKKLDITIETVTLDFTNTSEPMMWRLIPIWQNYDCVFLRDIDSLPNKEEYFCTTYFEKNEYAIQTMRSHENHYHEMGCDMLGGLCGFKPNMINEKPNTFSDYYFSKMDLPWAQDQFMITKTFIHDQSPMFLETNFLDCPINDQSKKAPFPHTSIPPSVVKQEEKDLLKKTVLDIIHKHKIAKWAGQPCDARGEVLKDLISVDCDASQEVKKALDDDKLKEFYGM